MYEGGREGGAACSLFRCSVRHRNLLALRDGVCGDNGPSLSYIFMYYCVF
jgi:hypothetical protein